MRLNSTSANHKKSFQRNGAFQIGLAPKEQRKKLCHRLVHLKTGPAVSVGGKRLVWVQKKNFAC